MHLHSVVSPNLFGKLSGKAELRFRSFHWFQLRSHARSAPLVQAQRSVVSHSHMVCAIEDQESADYGRQCQKEFGSCETFEPVGIRCE